EAGSTPTTPSSSTTSTNHNDHPARRRVMSTLSVSEVDSRPPRKLRRARAQHVPAKPGTGSIAARPGQTIRRLLFPLSKSGRGKANRHGHPVRKLHAAPRHGRGRAGARGAPRPGFGSPPEGALMARTVSDFVVQRLCDWGIRRVFGYPGDGINGFLGALDRASDRMEYVQVRHEEMAAFMACAHAKFTGEVGVCIATSGPGAIHLLNGLYDAKMDHQPVVAIVGQSATFALGGDFQQEVDLAN